MMSISKYCWIFVYSQDAIVLRDKVLFDKGASARLGLGLIPGVAALLPASSVVLTKPWPLSRLQSEKSDPYGADAFTTPWPKGKAQYEEQSAAAISFNAVGLQLGQSLEAKLAHSELIMIDGGFEEATEWIKSETGCLMVKFCTHFSLSKIGQF
jgi:hypothetical protein